MLAFSLKEIPTFRKAPLPSYCDQLMVLPGLSPGHVDRTAQASQRAPYASGMTRPDVLSDRQEAVLRGIRDWVAETGGARPSGAAVDFADATGTAPVDLVPSSGSPLPGGLILPSAWYPPGV